ncbi:MAG: hypothetical protein LC754_10310, partial [Acidobacteria bacterium]|nr:hypothetical protein [Acidobacteriota bacterium]
VVGDVIALTKPLPFVPAVNDEVTQAVLDDKDKVRLFSGDTDASDPQLQDEEIAAILLYRRNIFRATALACETIAAKLARKVTYQIYQEIQERLTEQQQSYLHLAKVFDKRAATTDATPFNGGLLVSSHVLALADTMRVQPYFSRGMMTEPGTDGAIDNDAIYQPVD